MPDELVHGSWFSGIGGFDIGFERAGFRTAFHSEVDPFANTILERHWPEVPNLGCIQGVRAQQLHVDTLRAGRFICPLDSSAGSEERDADRRVDGGGDTGDRGERGPADSDGGTVRNRDGWSAAAGDLLGSADVWTGGFPCQDLSVAGKQAGLAGSRSGLALAFLELAREYRPPWIVLENVPGLLSSNKGRDLAVLLDIMEDIGYADIAWRVLDARYFGVAQRRRRVFIVASHRANGAREVLFEPGSGGGYHPARRAAGEDLAYALADSTGTRTGSGRDAQDTFLVTGTLRSHPRPDSNSNGALLVADIAPTLNSNRQGGWRYDADQAEGLIAFTGRTGPESISPTLRVGGRASAHTAGSSVDNTPHVVIPAGDRETPDAARVREAAGLPGRVDDPRSGPLVYRKSQRAREVDGEESWRDAEVANTLNTFDIGSRDTHAIMSSVEEDPRLPKGLDSPRYRVLGNAVCVPVAEWIASRIRAVELDT